MTKLNSKGQSKAAKAPVAISHNGNPQYFHEDLFSLYNLIVSHFFGKDSFYESNDQRLVQLQQLTNKLVLADKLDFIANAIINARTKMHMRTMPLFLTVVFAKALRSHNKSFPKMRELVSDVIQRADQITDMYAAALSIFGSKNKIPLAIKRGVADAFNKFNAYQFGKYNTKNAVKLSDVLRITHPTPVTEAQGTIFQNIISDTLEIPYTWETVLSKNGQLVGSEKKTDAQLWNELIESNKLGYMATLRNLKNMWESDISHNNKLKVCNFLCDKNQVLKSKQFPFRFVNAIEMVESFNDSRLITSLSSAIDISLNNLPNIGDNIWIIVDTSGSMSGTPSKAANLFTAALAKANKSSTNLKVTMFSSNANHIGMNTNDSVTSIAAFLDRKVAGGGTNLDAALKLKSTLGFEPDTVIVLSDMQVNQLDGGRSSVSKLFKKDTTLVAMNLAGHNTTPLSELDGWYQLSGWSDKIFDFIPAMKNKQTVVETLDRPYTKSGLVAESEFGES